MTPVPAAPVAASPAPRARARTKAPTWLKIMIGCGALLALAGIGVVLLIGAGMYWMVSPGQQIPTTLVVGPNSVGVLECGDLAQDAGARALLGRVFEELQKVSDRQSGGVPPFLGPLRELQRGQATQALSQWMPSGLTVSFEPDGQGSTHSILAVNFRAYIRPIRMMLERMMGSDSHVTQTRYRDETILDFHTGTVVCFAGGTVLVADHADLIREVLDRAARWKGPAPPLPATLAGPAGPWDARGTLLDPGQASTLLVALHQFAAPVEEGEEASDLTPLMGVTSARFGLDAQSADRAHVQLTFGYPDAEGAAAAASALEATLEKARRRAQEAGLDLTATARAQDASLEVDLQAEQIGQAITRWMSALEEQQERRHPRAE
jgi:hypothetical protein